MNYRQARQLKDVEGNPLKLWHYTNMNDGRIWPIGYCAQDCPGHETEEGAQEHQRQYLLDNARFDLTIAKQQRECEVCGVWTQRAAEVDHMDIHILCDAHCNRESLEKLVKKPGYSVSSW